MTDTVGKISNVLKKMIDVKGPGYLACEPYSAFKELIGSGAADRKTASAILCFLTNDMLKDVSGESDFVLMSKRVQKECGFNKKTADRVTAIFIALYTQDNEKEWKNKELEGLAKFKKENFVCTWKGYAYWDAGGGGVACHYESEIILISKKLVLDKKLQQAIEKNPFMTNEAISEHYRKSLREYLDLEFEEYCTCEEYYQPTVEDFEIDHRVEEWCKRNGFEVISCEGSGYDDGYEPSFRRGW